MSGVCPIDPARDRVTYDDTPPAKDSLPLIDPNGKFNVCGLSDNLDTIVAPRPDGEVITNTICCPTPGPPGPIGPEACPHGFLFRDAWADGSTYAIYDEAFDVCTDDVVLAADGNNYIAILDHTSSATDEPGVGAQWTTYWKLFLQGTQDAPLQTCVDGVSFVAGQMVTCNGCVYSASGDVTLDSNDPDTYPDFNLDGGFYWDLISCPEEASWLDQLLNGANDWIKDIANWGLENLLGDFLAETILGGTDVDTEFNFDGGNVDNNYTGTETIALVVSPTVQDVVGRICDLRGVPSSDYDTTLLPTTEMNMTLGSITTGRTVLDLLSLTYQYGMVDIGVLKFIPHKPATTIKNLTADFDLGFTSNELLPPPPISVKRLQAYDLPKEVNLTYQSTANAHEQFIQTATLETQTDGKIVNLEVPMSLSEQEAYDIAERILVNAHIGRTTYSFTTTYRNIELEPEDIINVDIVGDLRILRIEEDSQGGILNFVCVNAANNDYTGTASGLAPATPPPYLEAPKIVGASSAIIFESAVLTPLDTDKLRIRIAPHGYGVANWAGCDILYSTDGVNYIEYAQATKQADWGRVPLSLGGFVIAGSFNNGFDEVNTLTVDMKIGSFTNATEAEVIAGSNLILVGQEILGFKNATNIGGDTWELTGLLRGQYGTENHTQDHTDKEVVVVLDDRIINFEIDATELGTQYYFKFVTKGESL